MLQCESDCRKPGTVLIHMSPTLLESMLKIETGLWAQRLESVIVVERYGFLVCDLVLSGIARIPSRARSFVH